MQEGQWSFVDAYGTMVVTSRAVVHDQRPILYVSHDADDGMWQFHDGSTVNAKDAMVVGLGEVVDMDPTLRYLADLPLGWCARRAERNEPWKRQKSK
jgi:hypothetical protein